MKRKNQTAQHYRALTLTFLFSLIFSVMAGASEKFVLSASHGPNLILRTFELDQNKIKTVDSNVIETGISPGLFHDGIFNTAVAFRNDNNTLVFDVYYGVCQDIDCVNATVSMKRLDSNLQLKFGQDFSIPVAYSLSAARLQRPSGLSLRLFLGNPRTPEERRLDENGIPGEAKDIKIGNYNVSASEDGKMIVAEVNRNSIQGSHSPSERPHKKDANG